MKLPKDNFLGNLLSFVLLVLTFLLAWLILTFPFSSSPSDQVVAIATVGGIMSAIVGVRAARR